MKSSDVLCSPKLFYNIEVRNIIPIVPNHFIWKILSSCKQTEILIRLKIETMHKKGIVSHNIKKGHCDDADIWSSLRQQVILNVGLHGHVRDPRPHFAAPRGEEAMPLIGPRANRVFFNNSKTPQRTIKTHNIRSDENTHHINCSLQWIIASFWHFLMDYDIDWRNKFSLTSEATNGKDGNLYRMPAGGRPGGCHSLKKT